MLGTEVRNRISAGYGTLSNERELWTRWSRFPRPACSHTLPTARCPPPRAAVASLGEGNPASEELDFMLALIGLREMEADGVTDATRRQELLAAMEVRRRGGRARMGVAPALQLRLPLATPRTGWRGACHAAVAGQARGTSCATSRQVRLSACMGGSPSFCLLLQLTSSCSRTTSASWRPMETNTCWCKRRESCMWTPLAA